MAWSMESYSLDTMHYGLGTKGKEPKFGTLNFQINPKFSSRVTHFGYVLGCMNLFLASC
jgi:hypothetical protein